MCSANAGTADTLTNVDGKEIVISQCLSNPGADGMYGTGDDGTIYYREAQENALRAFTRENRAHSFSFINGIGVNHPELCGDLTSAGKLVVASPGADKIFDTGDDFGPDGVNGTKDDPTTELAATGTAANECGDSPSTGTRQVMFQNIQDLGATLSCFNCSSLGQHTVPSHGFDRYSFKWTPLPGVHIPESHPNANGTIPE
jgi:hypothetical protein